VSVIAATLLTDRKPVFPVSLEYIVNEPLIEKIYVNVETTDPYKWQEVVIYMDGKGKPWDIDYWSVNSSWAQKPNYDQDPSRFMPIARGRDMALDWAVVQTMMNADVSHLLFLDSDVRPHRGGLQLLLDLHTPICGGLVPGRGAHSDARYVFGMERRDQTGQPKHILRTEHGTSGYLLIEKEVFEVIRFRAGPTIERRWMNVNGERVFAREFVCDDPAFATDAYHAGLAESWYIDTRATADHVDDPDHPLTLDEAINDYNNP